MAFFTRSEKNALFSGDGGYAQESNPDAATNAKPTRNFIDKERQSRLLLTDEALRPWDLSSSPHGR